MATVSFALSAFGDEIAEDLNEQLTALREMNINYLDLRSAWGKSLLQMDDTDVKRLGQICASHGVKVACLGSPIGKSPIEAPIDDELSHLARICQIGRSLGCHRIRVFSFYPPIAERDAHSDQYVEIAVSRLAQLTELAEREGVLLLLENEKKIVGDTIRRCHALLRSLDTQHLRFLWDPANFVQVGEALPTEHGWPLLGDYVGYVHIKDAHLSDGAVCPAGEGDGQIGTLLTRLKKAGYRGVLALEPHLVHAGHSSGFTGASNMRRAAEALRHLMKQNDCVESDHI